MYLRCSLKTKEGFLDLNIDGAAPAKLLFRVNEACSVLGLGRTSLYKEIAAGRLRVVRAAGRTLLARRDLDGKSCDAQFAENGRCTARSPAAGIAVVEGRASR